MKNRMIEFLSENDKLSMMRLMSAVSLLAGIVIAVVGIVMGKDLGGVAELVAVFIVPAFGGKIAQKVTEK